MMNQTSEKEMLQKEEVRRALWNTILPTSREVDPVLWDSVVEVVEERIVEYLRDSPRQQAKRADFATNIVEKEGPPASLDQVITYLVDRKVLIPVEVFNLERIAIRENSTDVKSFLSNTVSYSFELLRQMCKPVVGWWIGFGDNSASEVLTHKCLLEELITKLWYFIEEQQETHIGGRFLVQELSCVFSGDDILCHRALYVLVQRGKAVVYEIEKDIYGVKFGADLSVKESDKNIFSVMYQIARLERHIDNLNLKLFKIEKSLKSCGEKLNKHKSSQNQLYLMERKRAAQLLRISKYLGSSIDRSYQQLSNLNEILCSSEAAEFSQQATQALKVGRDAMNSLKEDQSLEEIDDIMLDLQEHMETQQEIDDILSSPMVSQSEELEEDLNRLEASLEETSPQEQVEAFSLRKSVVKDKSLPTSPNVERNQQSSSHPVPLHS